MKIIFSPAKEFNLSVSQSQEWNLTESSQALVAELLKLNNKQLKDQLRINQNQLSQVVEYHQNFKHPITYEAISMYNGLAYRNMPLDRNQATQVYLQDHVRILSALYGPIKPTQLIKPYRLDFTTKLKINQQSLTKFWQGKFDELFESGETILNLASQEFASQLQQERYDWVDFEFYQLKDGEYKQHSTYSKKARGQMLAYLVNNQVQELESIKEFDGDGYQFSPKQSKKNVLVFIKEV